MSSGLGMGGKGPERPAVGEDSGSIYGDVTWSLRKEETLEKCMTITQLERGQGRDARVGKKRKRKGDKEGECIRIEGMRTGCTYGKGCLINEARICPTLSHMWTLQEIGSQTKLEMAF